MSRIEPLVSGTLAQLEKVIEQGLSTFVEVGRALLEIRDKRLYLETHGNFESYCRERWHWSKTHANRQIEAAQVANALTPIGVKPSSEWHAREILNGLGSEQREEVREGTPSPETVERMALHFSSDSCEWYTPPEIIQRAVAVLGTIDLDPCSNEARNIPATAHFTQAEDGLKQPWTGRVYMNPPYGREISPWVEKLVCAHACKSVTEAIALVPARVDTDWFRRFRDYAVCFINGRLKFSGHENAAPFPSAVIYLGGDIAEFSDEFSEIGDIWVRWRQ